MDVKMELQLLLAQTKSGKHLSEYHLKLLKKQKISTPQEFVDATNLHKLLALNIEKVELIKKEILSLFVKNVTLRQVYASTSFDYTTGNEELDKLLSSIGQSLRPGRIWEICGETSVGKTEFLHTLATNFVSNYAEKSFEVLYIDTKRELDPARLYEMLQNRQLGSETIRNCMNAIKVLESHSAQDLVANLETMLEKLSNCDEAVCRIKLILVDSLAASYMLMRSSYERNTGLRFLTKLAMLLRTLASQHGIAFVLGNLTLCSNDEFDDEDNDDVLTQSSAETQDDISLLGDFWDSVCTLSLTLELPEDASSDGLRLLRVSNNSYGSSGNSCLLRITDAGFF